MIKTIKDIGYMRGGALFILISALSFFLSIGLNVEAGVYLNSAHGDDSYGVNRSGASGFPSDYPEGFCAHCHEQHASIGGSEPAPSGGAPSKFALFYYPGFPSQTDNFCYQCHTGSGSYQYNEAAITNLLYSERAGGWNTSPDDILEAFSYSSPGTSHNLDNISTFITGKWSYTADSNPCNACHNLHAAQGDPLGDGGGTTASKTTTLANRGWPVSLPSQHNTNNTTWGLLGDGSGEKMSDYIATNGGTYQAPYMYNSTIGYEPDGSSTTDGSNLADYATFCTDCHNSTNTAIYSTTLGRNLYAFDWGSSSTTSEKHGRGDATDEGEFGGGSMDDVIAPYDESTYTNYVLACTDCHEPHGSANRFLIREGVNGGTATTSVTLLASSTPDNTKEWKNLCSKCHDTSLMNNKRIHHKAYNDKFGGSYSYCIYCHEPDADDMRNCLQCHYHGNEEWPAVDDYGLGAYNYGEKMF